MSDIVVGIIAGSIVALISFILGLFGNIGYARYQENRQRQNEALKKHFTDLETYVFKPLIKMLKQIINQQGTLWLYDGEKKVYSNPKLFYLPMEDIKSLLSFNIHFKNKTEDIEKLISNIVDNNELTNLFTKNLEKLVRDKTNIPVKNVANVEAGEIPFIYAEVPTYLRLSLSYLAERNIDQKASLSQYFDFRNAEIKKEYDYWRLHGSGVAYAQLATEQEAILCKEILIELMESDELQKETHFIFRNASRLEIGARRIAYELDTIIQQHAKYGKLLKRKRECTICKIIFE